MCWCIIPLGCSFNLIIKCMLFYYALFYEQLFILLNLKMLYRNESLTKLTSGCQYIAFSWNHSISFLCSSKLGNSSTFSRETGTSDVFPFLNLIVALIVAEDPFKFWTDQSLTLSNFSGLCKNIGSPIFGMILVLILFPLRWLFCTLFNVVWNLPRPQVSGITEVIMDYLWHHANSWQRTSNQWRPFQWLTVGFNETVGAQYVGVRIQTKRSFI